MSLYPLISPAAGATEFPAGVTPAWRHRADTGITGDPVTAWTDMNGDADINSTEGGGAPDFQATGGPNGEPCVVFDGSDDRLAADGLTAIDPSTTIHVFVVCKQISFTGGENVMGYKGSTHNMQVCKSAGTTPAVVMSTSSTYNANSVTGMVLGEWHLYHALFIDSSLAYAQVDDGTPATGAVAFTQTLTRCVMCADDNMASIPAHFAVAEHVMVASRVSGADLTQLLTYFNDRYALW
jgi:hypothetical protein